MQQLSINIKVVWREVFCIMGQGVTDRQLFYPLQQRRIYLPKILLCHDIQSSKDFPCPIKKKNTQLPTLDNTVQAIWMGKTPGLIVAGLLIRQ